MEIDKKERSIKLNSSEFALLKNFSKFKLIRLSDNVFAIVAAERPAKEQLRKAIESKLKKARLQQRVEGRFEKLLSEEELELFNRMLEQGEIIRFKLSEKYKKAIYKLRSEYEAERKRSKAKSMPELSKNGYTVLSKEEEAKEIASKYAEQLKKGELLGIKGFDGNYYFIEKKLLDKLRKKIVAALAEVNEIRINKLREVVAAPEDMIKAACEVLKEQGEIIEKRKGLYALA
ncbi:MAG: hypothetical protein J7L14_02980 [Candidatus Diapherotrites archaeon]|nr:hypothetical protein [Candidatus Diapherotrites archaeon]